MKRSIGLVTLLGFLPFGLTPLSPLHADETSVENDSDRIGSCYFGVAQPSTPYPPVRLSKRRISRSQAEARFGINITPENKAQWLDQDFLQVQTRFLDGKKFERFLKHYTDREASDFPEYNGCLIHKIQVDGSSMQLPRFRLENAARYAALPLIALGETLAVVGSLGVYPALIWGETGPYPLTEQWRDTTQTKSHLVVPYFLVKESQDCSSDFIREEKIVRPYVVCE